MPRVKAETKVAVKPVAKKEAVKKPAGLTVPSFDLTGKEAGSLELPKEVFGAKVNKPLLAQAVRVYLNNQKSHHSSTKTRGEVIGSTRKIYRQKGTGGARHGAKKAPIFVGGGIALGPKYRKVILDLPKKMKQAALISALSSKMSDGQIFGLGSVDKATGKTAQMKKLFKTLDKRNVLIVTDSQAEMVSRAIKNLPAIDWTTTEQLNILEIIAHRTLMLTKEAVTKLESRIMNHESSKKEKE